MGKAPRPRYCRRCPGRLLLAECAHSKNGGSPLIDENPSNDVAAVPPAVDAPTSIPMIEPVVPTAIPAAQGLAGLGPSALQQGLVDDSQIDPMLLEISKRVRVTAKNPIHGYVEGCSRGTQPYSVRRPITLRPAIMESGKATKRYYREVNNIIAQCERLGKETGCLILFNAQHLNATGPGLTFASGRLLSEAYDDTVALGSRFNRMASVLLTARRRTMVDMVEEINTLRREKEDAEKRAEEARVALSQVRGRGKDALADALLRNLEEMELNSTESGGEMDED